jgi:hypothetical protein
VKWHGRQAQELEMSEQKNRASAKGTGKTALRLDRETILNIKSGLRAGPINWPDSDKSERCNTLVNSRCDSTIDSLFCRA